MGTLTKISTAEDEMARVAHAEHRLSGVEVGIVGVAAHPARPCAAWTSMDAYAALISRTTPLHAVRRPLSCRHARTVADRIIGCASPVSAVFVVGLGSSDSASVQRRVTDHGGPMVITELDVVTVALAAAAMATLRRQGIAARRGRIVVINTESAPRLSQILLAASGTAVTSWRQRDAPVYPLWRVMSRNDVLIDLSGTASGNVAPGRTLTLPIARFDHAALVLPGLLSAVCGRNESTLTLDMLVGCVRALALLTAEGHVLPEIGQRLLIPAVTRHVARTLTEQSPQRVRYQH